MMTEQKHFDRLREEQERAIDQTKQRIQTLTKYKEDYEVLQKRLQTLPDKVTHEVMVPFGKLAFMPGKLIHTNEVLALLGDNWFAERSTKQACEIIDRRITNIDASICSLKEQEGLLEPRLDFTQNLEQLNKEKSEFVEIREDYDEEKEKKWKVSHSQRVRKSRKQHQTDSVPTAVQSRLTDDSVPMEAQRQMTDDELWARLDELEIQEASRRELQSLPDEPEEVAAELQRERKVQWEESKKHSRMHGEEGTHGAGGDRRHDGDVMIRSSDEDYTDTEDSDDEDEEDSNEELGKYESSRRPCRVINFTHSDTKPQHQHNEDATTITCPADIKTTCPPKSILKKPSTADSHLPTQQKEGSRSSKAFSSSVVEHSTSAPSTVPQSSPGPTQPPTTASQPTKKVSKFRAQRMSNR